jgi:hypothetical protein
MAQAAFKGRRARGVPFRYRQSRRNQMPVILWLLGVPLVVVVALMLFNFI